MTFQGTIFECETDALFSGGSHNITFENCFVYHCITNNVFDGFAFNRGSQYKKLRFFRTKVHNYHQIVINNIEFEAILSEFRYSDFNETVTNASIKINNSYMDAHKTTIDACSLGDLSGTMLDISHDVSGCFICGEVIFRGNQLTKVNVGHGLAVKGSVVYSSNNTFADIKGTSMNVAVSNRGVLISSGDYFWNNVFQGTSNLGIFSNALFAVVANPRFNHISSSIRSNGAFFINNARDIYGTANSNHSFLSVFGAPLSVTNSEIEVSSGNNAMLEHGIGALASFGWIENNSITAPESTNSRGIQVTSPTSLSFNYGTSIATNDLTNCGILISGSDKHLWSNTITRTANTGITASLAPFNRYCFNNLTGGIGMNFSGNCDNSAIFKNKFYGGVTGLRANDMLGDQHINVASEIERNMNEWTGTYSDLGARHTGSPNTYDNSRIFNNGSSINRPAHSPNGWFPVVNGTPEKYACSDDLYKPVLRDIEIMIVKDSVVSTPVSQWMLRKQTFYELTQKPDIIENDAEVENWYKNNEYLLPLIQMHRQLDKVYPDSVTRAVIQSLSRYIDSLHTEWSERLPEADSLMTLFVYDSLYTNLNPGIIQLQEDLVAHKDSLSDIMLAHLDNKALRFDSAYLHLADFIPADRESIVEECQLSSRSRQGDGNFVNNKEIQIYPNPASGTLNIKSTKTLDKIEIFNFFGVEVKSEFAPDNVIDIRSLPPGVYLLRVSQQDGEGSVVKFVRVMN